MSNIKILKGKTLSKAITGAATKFATFGKFIHEIAYGALLHCHEHHDSIYMNRVLEVAPTNYRPAIVTWFKDFSNAAYDNKTRTFTYSKSKTADTESALAKGPMEYVREQKSGTDKPKDSLMVRTVKAFEKVVKDPDANREDKAFAKAMLKVIDTMNTATPAATVKPKAAKTPAKAKATANTNKATDKAA